MASITSLPTELLDQIANENLDQDDLLAIRSTCKILNTKFQEAHLNSIFSCRRVFLVPASLENLVKISKHPSDVNLRVRKIIIARYVPYTKLSIKSQWRYEAITKEIIQTTDANSDEVRDLYEHNKYLVLLTTAFSNLPNIRTLSFDFEGVEDLSRSEINLIYPRLEYGPGVRGDGSSKALVEEVSRFIAKDNNRYEFDYPCPTGKDIFSMVLYTAVATGLKGIERIDDSNSNWDGLMNDQIALKPYYLRQLKSTFSNLRTLHMTIHMATNAATCLKFKLWIQAFGQNLEDLKIRNTNYWQSDYDIMLLPHGVLTKLKIIRFCSFNFEIEDFITFVDGFMELKLLKLENCNFKDSIEDWYRLLKHLRRNHSALRRIVINTKFKGDDFNGPRETDLDISSLPGSDDTVFQVETISGRDIFGKRTLKLKLDDQPGAVEFWDTINGLTESK
ncbi:hypothetical protein TWF506_003184 [Arthrobotrys conoides]|uniref:F-box domain-containing protein n=1 Tax=Arthrobotrys conoides TaxID=74498 RepID=A0AAN8RJF2_9PEZI